MEVVLLIIGVLAGFIAGWFFAGRNYAGKEKEYNIKTENLRNQVNELTIQSKVQEEKLNNLIGTNGQLKIEMGEKNKELLNLSTQLTSKTSDYEHLLQKLKEQKSELDQIREKFTAEFRNLANEIFDEKSKKFTEQNKSNIDQILKPLGERLKDFEKKVDDVYVKEAQQRFSLKEEVKRLAELNQKVSEEAHNLTRALKGESKIQGNWGEMILESILEKSGLVRDREYFIQKSFTSPDGRRLQPDVIVSYPGNKNVVIDSKVSLVAYEKHISTENENNREAALKEHLISVRRHIDQLSSKNYQNIHSLNSLDFVMMFMPVEPAFLLAIGQDSNLWSYAYEKGILLISPTNLIAALKMVSSMWHQEYQSRNVLEIASESGKLYDKFVGLINDLDDVGKRMLATRNAYDSAMNKLKHGRGNLVAKVEKIKILGAKTTRELPVELIENANENEQK
nr:DNA recombination protein RmuC [Bacteroidota bacterium]